MVNGGRLANKRPKNAPSYAEHQQVDCNKIQLFKHLIQ